MQGQPQEISFHSLTEIKWDLSSAITLESEKVKL